MRVLITGASGFAGRHLSELALKKGAQVYGLVRPAGVSKLVQGVHPLPGDMKDASSLEAALRQAKPERIFHLAAQTNVDKAKKDPGETREVNVEGTRRLLEAVRSLAPKARVLVSGSSDAYGKTAEQVRELSEENELSPTNPYGESKAAQERLALEYHRRFGLDVVCIRAFNHSGPGQEKEFVVPCFASQIAAIEKKIQDPKIKTQGLDSKRDFTDVRDVVGAYWLALEKGKKGEIYNVASGRGCSAGEILEFYLKQVSVKIDLESVPRPGDIPYFVGNAQKFMNETGWQPRIPFETMLQDVLDDWRKRQNG